MEQQQSPLPLAPLTASARSTDAEAAVTPDDGAGKHSRKIKRKKCILYILLFIIFQTGIILLFTFTVMKIRTPKFRFLSATFDNFNVGIPTNASLNIRLNAEVGVKNANFGRFKFETTTMYFFHRGTQVGEILVPKGRANWRSTKKFNVAVNITIAQENSMVSSDLNAGFVQLTSQAKLRGDVRLMLAIKKNRSSDLNCTMEIVTETEIIRNIVCK